MPTRTPQGRASVFPLGPIGVRRRFALWLGKRLMAAAFWLDLHTAPKYTPGGLKIHTDLTDAEWDELYALIRRDNVPVS